MGSNNLDYDFITEIDVSCTVNFLRRVMYYITFEGRLIDLNPSLHLTSLQLTSLNLSQSTPTCNMSLTDQSINTCTFLHVLNNCTHTHLLLYTVLYHFCSTQCIITIILVCLVFTYSSTQKQCYRAGD